MPDVDGRNYGQTWSSRPLTLGEDISRHATFWNLQFQLSGLWGLGSDEVKQQPPPRSLVMPVSPYPRLPRRLAEDPTIHSTLPDNIRHIFRDSLKTIFVASQRGGSDGRTSQLILD